MGHSQNHEDLLREVQGFIEGEKYYLGLKENDAYSINKMQSEETVKAIGKTQKKKKKKENKEKAQAANNKSMTKKEKKKEKAMTQLPQKKLSKKLRKQAPDSINSDDSEYEKFHYCINLKLNKNGEQILLDHLAELYFDSVNEEEMSKDEKLKGLFDLSSDSGNSLSSTSSNSSFPEIIDKFQAISLREKKMMLHSLIQQDRYDDGKKADPRQYLDIREKPNPTKREAISIEINPENVSIKLNLCFEKKDGSPNLSDIKIIVVEKSTTIPQLLNKGQGKFRIHKVPKSAGLVKNGVVTEWLDDILELNNNDLICFSNSKRKSSKKKEEKYEQNLDIEETTSTVNSIPFEEAFNSIPDIAQEPRTNVERKRITCTKNQNKLSKRLLEHAKNVQKTKQFKNMQKKRESLPIYPYKDTILSLIENNQVVLIEGETGSGKTTQVPQYILEDAINTGYSGICKILCTQPRRISAISVSTRVAAERAERLGQYVGYTIRLESKVTSDTRLVYMATGSLLRRLLVDPMLSSVSHVIVDEVHERGLETDFLLIILKELLVKRPTLKLILMSATLQHSLFSEYFNSCPRIVIPGRTYPVRTLFLENIIEIVGKSKVNNSFSRIEKKMERRSKATKNFEETHLSDVSKISVSPKEILNVVIHIIESESSSKDDSNVEGSILIFMTGLEEINQLIKKMKEESKLHSCVIFPLHSTLSPEDQQKVFNPVQNGMRKIVVATNIAETSITIDDCTHVIDCGKVKETRFTSETSLSSLVEVWTSKASAMQRAGI